MRFGEWDFVNASITNIFSMPAFWLMYRSRDAKIKYESTSSTIGHTISIGWNPCHGIRPLRGYHPHPRLALTDENVLKSYEAATAQICWFFFFSLIFLTSPSSNWCQLHLWTFSFSSLLIKQLKWREQYMRVEREIGEEECFLLFAAAAIQPLLPHCCHWAAPPLMPLFSNAIFRRKKMANSNQYWKRNKNNVRSIWIVYLFPMFKTMAKNGGVPFFRHRL